MECPRCHQENRAESRFCEDCGAPFAVKCPSCSAALTAGKRFCGACGNPVREQAVPLASSAESARVPEAERRQITVMFCDLVGSTALTQHLDPEPLREVMRAYQQSCAAVVERYDGHVAQYLGDGLLVYFGWPRAHEDAAERSVRAGLDIIETIKLVGAPEPLRVRIGISTGSVVIGETGGGDPSVPKVAVGEAPNLAARLQGLAGADQIVVGPSTHQLLGAAFEYQDLGDHALKGLAEPVRAWRVGRPRRAGGRFEAVHATGLTPLVGREEEIALLLRRWDQAKAGEGQVVLLGGEPGIGKSRIARVLLEQVGTEPHFRLRYQCSPFHTQSALYPVIDQLERAARFEPDDDAEAKLDKLEAILTLSGLRDGSVRALFAALLSLPVDRYSPLTYEPQKLREKTLEVLIGEVEGLSGRKPVLMVFEDVHWVDPTTQEILDLLVPRVQDLRVLLVVTYRPGYPSPWSGQSHVTTLLLNRLRRRQSAQLAVEVAGGRPLPDEVLDQIVAKTDGVPLFVEELTKAVLESGRIRLERGQYELTGPLTALAIPSTLQDSLMARLDRLAPVKEVAQVAACLGREVAYELLSAIIELPESQLHSALAQLVNSELIFERGLPPAAVYTFKHALVQDAAYASLLKSRRQILHRKIAQTLEGRFPGRAATEPEVVAHHYTAAGLHDRAVSYWLEAGRRAVQRSAYAEAIAQLTRGLESLAGLSPAPARDRTELLLQINLGTALGASKGYAPPEVGRTFGRARELCERVGDLAQMYPILQGLWTHHMMRTEFPPAGAVAGQLHEMAERANDPGAVVLGRWCSAGSAFFAGNFANAAAHAEAGWAAYRPADHQSLALQFGFNPAAGCLGKAAWAHWLLGHCDLARRRAREAVRFAVDLGHSYTTVSIAVHAAIFDHFSRDVSAALEHARLCIAVADELGIPVRKAEAQMVEGWALAELGQVTHGIELIRRGLDVWHRAGTTLGNPLFLAMLAEALHKAGRLEDARSALARALAAVQSSTERYWEAEVYRLDGELAFAAGEPDDRVERSLSHAIEVARSLEANILELRAATSYVRLTQQRGRPSEALSLLKRVYGWFTEGFDTPDLKEAKALLDELA